MEKRVRLLAACALVALAGCFSLRNCEYPSSIDEGFVECECVSALDDADVISVQIDSESTLEEVANIHDRNLEDLIRLNPEFKSGQKIPAGTAGKMPLF